MIWIILSFIFAILAFYLHESSKDVDSLQQNSKQTNVSNNNLYYKQSAFKKVMPNDNYEKNLYHEDFVCKTQGELRHMSHTDIFKYRCKEAVIQKMIPFRQTNNSGCQSEACKTLVSLAYQMVNNLELMEIAFVYGYSEQFSIIIYNEINLALQYYCNISIFDVWDYNKRYNTFEFDNSIEIYIKGKQFEQALNML